MESVTFDRLGLQCPVSYLISVIIPSPTASPFISLPRCSVLPFGPLIFLLTSGSALIATYVINLQCSPWNCFPYYLETASSCINEDVEPIIKITRVDL